MRQAVSAHSEPSILQAPVRGVYRAVSVRIKQDTEAYITQDPIKL